MKRLVPMIIVLSMLSPALGVDPTPATADAHEAPLCPVPLCEEDTRHLDARWDPERAYYTYADLEIHDGAASSTAVDVAAGSAITVTGEAWMWSDINNDGYINAPSTEQSLAYEIGAHHSPNDVECPPSPTCETLPRSDVFAGRSILVYPCTTPTYGTCAEGAWPPGTMVDRAWAERTYLGYSPGGPEWSMEPVPVLSGHPITLNFHDVACSTDTITCSTYDAILLPGGSAATGAGLSTALNVSVEPHDWTLADETQEPTPASEEPQEPGTNQCEDLLQGRTLEELWHEDPQQWLAIINATGTANDCYTLICPWLMEPFAWADIALTCTPPEECEDLEALYGRVMVPVQTHVNNALGLINPPANPVTPKVIEVLRWVLVRPAFYCDPSSGSGAGSPCPEDVVTISILPGTDVRASARVILTVDTGSPESATASHCVRSSGTAAGTSTYYLGENGWVRAGTGAPYCDLAERYDVRVYPASVSERNAYYGC